MFLKWTLPPLDLDKATDANIVKIRNKMTNSVDPDKTARFAVSSGSTLFAQLSVLVCRAERVNSQTI